MSTSPTVSLFKIDGAKKIARAALAYIHARGRHSAYNLLVSEFKKAGITQIELANRLGTSPEIICRLLKRPGNWEINTFSGAIFALTGGFLTFGVAHPVRNIVYVFPESDVELQPTETHTRAPRLQAA